MSKIKTGFIFFFFQFQYDKRLPKPFLTDASILYPLKTSENLWFSGVFRGYKMGTLVKNGLISVIVNYIPIFQKSGIHSQSNLSKTGKSNLVS